MSVGHLFVFLEKKFSESVFCFAALLLRFLYITLNIKTETELNSLAKLKKEVFKLNRRKVRLEPTRLDNYRESSEKLLVTTKPRASENTVPKEILRFCCDPSLTFFLL